MCWSFDGEVSNFAILETQPSVTVDALSITTSSDFANCPPSHSFRDGPKTEADISPRPYTVLLSYQETDS